jgi:hypothetical protein
MSRLQSARRRRSAQSRHPLQARLTFERLEERRVLANLQILSLTTDNASLAEHNFITGDDRGGIAISDTDVFYTGDGGTGAFPVNSIGSGSNIGIFYDALISDVGSGAVYSLGVTATTPMSYGGGAVTHLIELDGTTGAQTGSSVELSTPVSIFSGAGIFAGNAKVVLWDASSGVATSIDTSTGAVTNLGTVFVVMNGTENWANWGVAEEFGGDDYLTYLSGSDVLRTRISDGATSTVASFPAGISDMAVFTVSDDLQRWYFHYEGFSGAFGFGSDETIGYADADIKTGLSVNSSDPADGAVVASPSTDFVLAFSDDYDPDSVAASDLTVNGVPADSVLLTDANTLTFQFAISPVTAEGSQSMHMAEGAISSLIDGDPIEAYTAEFNYDTLLMQVVSTTPADGAVVLLPTTTLDLHFNEAYDLASVVPNDFLLSQGSVTGVEQVDADTLRVTLNGVSSEGALTVNLPAGAVTDVFGNAGAAFSASFILDFGTAPYPAPLNSTAPAGGLIYEGSVLGLMDPSGDIDNFTIELDAGQTFTALVTSSESLQANVFLYDPASTLIGSASAAAPGADAVMQAVEITTPGAYTITTAGVGGAVGSYRLQVYLNAAVEDELHGGASNDTLIGAQDIEGSFIDLAGGVAKRGAVIGNVTAPLALYASNQNAQWLEIDPATGAARLIASDVNNGYGYADIARNPVTGVIYGTGARNDSGLYTIDPATGAGTLIGTPGSGTHSLVWSPDGGTLYGVSLGALGEIYPSTGEFTYLVSAPDFVHGLAFQPGTGTPYAVVGRFSGALYTVDPGTGAFNFVASLSRAYLSLEFLPDGTLLAGGNDSGLYTIDPVTGSEEFIGYTGSGALIGLEGLATDDAEDWYSFTLTAGQAATLALAGAGSETKLELFGSGGEALAIATPADNLGQILQSFLAPTAGSYYARVTRSAGQGEYQLVVTRDTDLDIETNSSIQTAQDLSGSGSTGHRALGYAASTKIDHSSGFSDPNDLTSNGTAVFTSNVARLTGDGPWELGSVFSQTPTPIASFDTEFTFQIIPGTAPMADGITFTIQAAGNNALGFAGNGMGYHGIPNSVAVKFDIFDPLSWLPISQTGIYTDGVEPQSQSIDLLPWGIDLTSQNPFRVNMQYDGTTLAVTITDTITLASGSQTYAIDIPSVIGASEAFVGFTSATGELGAFHDIHSWSFASSDSDYYRVSVTSGDVLSISTGTPVGDPQQPYQIHNLLDPAVELFDPSGNLVAANDNDGPDGKNALLSHTALVAGTYYVRVLAAANSGEYVLSVNGATGAPSAFSVTSIDPPDGYSSRNAPTHVTVDFNDGVLLTSLDTNDLTVDGLPMTDVTVLDGDTVRFAVPAEAATEGTHTFTIAAGAIHDLQGTPIGTFSSQYSLDLTAPRVVASSIQNGATSPAGNLSYQVTFSEPLAVANVDASDFLLEQVNQYAWHQPTSFSFDASGTVLTLNYADLPDDAYRLTLYSGDGRIEDLAGWDLDGEPLAWPIPSNRSGDGVEGGDFSLQLALDADEIPLSAEFTAQSPLGSLIYDATVTGVISTIGDKDNYTLRVDPGQSIMLIVEAIDATLRPEVKLYKQDDHGCDDDDDGEQVGRGVAPEAGGTALISAVQVPSHLFSSSSPKYYKIAVRGANGTIGAYRLRVVLNADSEREDYGGKSNGTRSKAQSLEDTFLLLDTSNPKAERGAVEGRLRGGPADGDVYVVSRDYSFGGNVTRIDAFGNIAQVIDSPEFDRGYLTDVEFGPNNVLYVGLALPATSYGDPARGELLRFDLAGDFLGSLVLPDDAGYNGRQYPNGFDIAPDGSAWVPQTNGNALIQVGADGTLLGSYPLSGLPSDAAINADGLLYVSLFDSSTYAGKIVQVDPTTSTVVDFVAYTGSYDYTLGYLNAADDGGLWYSDFYNGTTHYDAAGNPTQTIYASYAIDPQQDPSDNLWISSQYYGVQRFDASGNYQVGAYPGGYPMGLAVAGVDSATPLPEGDFADFYSFRLERGNSASIALENVSGFGAALEIQDAAGNAVALGDNGRVDQFVASKNGTYYVKVSGSGVQYNLLVTRNADFDQGNNYSLDSAQDLLGTSTNGVQTSGERTVLGNLDSWAGDHYRLSVAPGQTIDGVVRIPAAGNGAFVNLLDPAVRIYDPAGNVVLTAEPNAREVSFKYKVPGNGSGGVYTIELFSSTNTPSPMSGEYILNLKSLTTPLPALEVISTNPANDSLLNFAPTQFVVDFNDAIQASTLQAGDLLIDGQPASSVTMLDGDTAMFEARPVFEYNGHFYFLTSGAMFWEEAEAEATSLGGHLAAISDDAENTFLATAFFGDFYWIGLNDVAEEGNFVWTSGETVTYTNWAPGEPNDFGSGEDGTTFNWARDIGIGLWNDDNRIFYGVIEVTARPSGAWTPSEGAHTLTLAAGAVKDLQGTPLSAYSGSFSIDTTPPKIVGSSIQEGDIISTGDLVYTIEFSESVQPWNFQYFNAYLSGQFNSYYPSIFEFNADATALTLYYYGVADDNYTLTVNYYGIVDQAGNYLDGEPLAWPIPPNTSGDRAPQGDFFVHFTAVSDPVLAPLPTPLTSVAPLGSHVYQTPDSTPGLITTADDIDDFTIDLDAGQRLTLAVVSQGAWLPVVKLYDPDGNQISTAAATDAGQTVLIQNAEVSLAGVYRVEVMSAGGLGAYTVQATLNAALEFEQHSGAANDDLAGAQALDGIFVDVGYGMAQGAVLGTTQDALPDIYSLQLDSGESLTLVVEDLSGTGVTLELLDGSGNLLASGAAGQDNVDQLLANFVAPDTGTYYVRLQGPDDHAYNLVLNRNAAFDVEQNDTQETAQDLASNRGTVGYINAPPLSGVIEYNGHYYFLTNLNQTWQNAEAEAVSYGGHLATINDSAENDFLASVFYFDRYWIGYNDYSEEGTFVWASGEAVTFTNWFSGEPNNAPPSEDGVEFISGLWNDMYNDQTRYGIVELTSPPVEEADWYNVTVADGESLILNASGSATGPGEFIDGLVPQITMYDALGNVLATAEGADATLTSDALAAGVYSVRVAASGLGAPGGEYQLGVTRAPGMLAQAPGISSLATDRALASLTPSLSSTNGLVSSRRNRGMAPDREAAAQVAGGRLFPGDRNWEAELSELPTERALAVLTKNHANAHDTLTDLLFSVHEEDWRPNLKGRSF